MITRLCCRASGRIIIPYFLMKNGCFKFGNPLVCRILAFTFNDARNCVMQLLCVHLFFITLVTQSEGKWLALMWQVSMRYWIQRNCLPWRSHVCFPVNTKKARFSCSLVSRCHVPTSNASHVSLLKELPAVITSIWYNKQCSSQTPETFPRTSELYSPVKSENIWIVLARL
jgi:hypothetical protein